MKKKTSTISISRDWRKRILYVIFSLIILCSIANFMLVILPRTLYSSEYVKINHAPEDKNKSGQGIEVEKDEFSHIKDIHKHDKKVDRKFCYGLECKFLLAYYPPTMEISTTNIEFITYIKLAESLGRIMVLTNVGSNKISTCQHFPFDFYYDVDKLKEMFPGVKFISQKDFQKWSYHRYDKPSTSHYYLINGGEQNSIMPVTSYSDTLRKKWCLDKFQLKLNDKTPFEQLRVSWNTWELEDGREVLQEFLVNSLQDNSKVLLIRHDIRQPLLLDEFPPLPYAKHIRDSSSKIINSLKPYIAIQWDIQHIAQYALPECAHNLLTQVQKTVDISSIENVYFASDYPLRYLNEIVSLNSSEPFFQPSSIWRHISVSHTKAMEMIATTIPFQTADSLGVMKHLQDALKDEFENSGVRNILDKLVCIEADIYIGLPRQHCTNPMDLKRSKVVVEMRNKLWNNLSKDIKNAFYTLSAEFIFAASLQSSTTSETSTEPTTKPSLDSPSCDERFLTYLPHSGFHNQHGSLMNAMLLSYITNRTLIIPPILIYYINPYKPYNTLYELLNKTVTIKKYRMTHCTNVTIENESSDDDDDLCSEEYSEYDKFTMLDWEQLFDFSEIKKYIKIVHRGYDFSLDTLLEQFSTSKNETFFIVESQHYDFRYFDNDHSEEGLERFKKKIFTSDLLKIDKKLLHFHSLFSHYRIVLEQPKNIHFNHLIHSNFMINNLKLLNISNKIMQILGGKGFYFGLHVRVGDGSFQNRLNENLKFINDELKKFLKNNTIPSLDTSYLNSNEKKKEYSTYSLQECLAHNLPIIYIATDAKKPIKTLKFLYDRFPCIFTLFDFNTDLKEFGKTSSDFAPNIDLLKFYIPIIDYLIVSYGGVFIGTVNSTFSRMAYEVHDLYRDGEFKHHF
ncbi:10433_t:CDS:2 [Funneliformis caledonium]|uniref:10433_t:CDS:1 n=1 Tax=Funneliformis caledonium TaxID=1117310 RepID=A0A9N9CMD2_9GLOM|nr:10433_t:CDS:2 [Funneliformis caledonium]